MELCRRLRVKVTMVTVDVAMVMVTLWPAAAASPSHISRVSTDSTTKMSWHFR